MRSKIKKYRNNKSRKLYNANLLRRCFKIFINGIVISREKSRIQAKVVEKAEYFHKVRLGNKSIEAMKKHTYRARVFKYLRQVYNHKLKAKYYAKMSDLYVECSVQNLRIS